MTPTYTDIDQIDLQILTLLMTDAKTPFTKIGELVGISDGTVHVRMKKLEQLGIVKGSTLVIDQIKLGFDLTAFIGIYLDKASDYTQVIDQLKEIPQVVEAHYITGGYSIFMKIVCNNTKQLREVLNDLIQPIAGIQRTETFISLEESINRPLKLK
jgi:Lrp/AsnC family transcriptional regulator, regulator for asnA, asnC and gidA